ncbi:MAG: hypothetical protein LBH11_02700 [Propionibacteriaceae bacterium]|nr:hypothetical protein [Propionibacteriaceae bacterium]
MSRRTSKHVRPARPLLLAENSFADKADGRWVTRANHEGQSVKEYVCPGCNQRIRVGEAHLVVWPHEPPLGATSAVDFRKHWHTNCWRRRR